MLVKILVVFILNGILVESRNIVSEKKWVTDLVGNEDFWTVYQGLSNNEQNIQNDLEKVQKLATFLVDISTAYGEWLSKLKDHSSEEFQSLPRTFQNRISTDSPSGRITLSEFLHHWIGLVQNAIGHNIIQPADHNSNRPEKSTTVTPVRTTEDFITTLPYSRHRKPTPDSNEHSEANGVYSNSTVLNASIDSESQPHNLESSSDVTTTLVNDGESTTVQDSSTQDSGNSTLNDELTE